MATIKKLENIKCWQSWGETGTLVRCYWDYKKVQFLWKTLWWFHGKIKNFLSYDPTMLFSHVHSKELKVDSQRDACYSHSHTVHNSQEVKQCKHISRDQWISKNLTHTHLYTHTHLQTHNTTPHHSLLFSLNKEGNPITCYNMNFENIMLSKINLSQKDKYFMISLYEVLTVVKIRDRK